MKFTNIIPLPKQIESSDQFYSLKEQTKVFYPTSDKRVLTFLNKLNIGVKLVDSISAADIVLLKEDINELPAGLSSEIINQSYVMDISPDVINIVAPDSTGIFYGLQSLGQLLLNREVPCGKIVDWPDMEFRGQHLTLGSGHMPLYDEFVNLIVKMGSFKINSFTIEYDGSFPWECYPFLEQSMSFTKDQYRSLIEIANDNFIDTIPLVDSLGHQEHYLCHDELKHLRELPNSIAELCAKNPQSKAFIKELWSEVLEVHKGAKYVNIAGDESFRLGDFCPRCKPYAESNSLATLHNEYFSELADWMLQQGHRPMMWNDMLIKHPEQLSNYSKDIILMDWCYFGKDLKSWDFTYGLNGPLYKDDLEFVPKDLHDLYLPYWFHESTAPNFTPWPYTRFFIDQGFEVIGASAGSVNINGKTPQPDFKSRIANPKSFASTISQANGKGVLNTFWASFTSIFTSWTSIVASADYSWHSRDEEPTDFMDRFDDVYLGTDGKFSTFVNSFDSREFSDDLGFEQANELPSKQADSEFIQLYDETTQACKRNKDYMEMFKPSLTYYNAKNELKRQSTDSMKSKIKSGVDTVIPIISKTNASYMAIPGKVSRGKLMLPPGKHYPLGVEVEILPGDHKNNNGIIIGSKSNPDFPLRIENIEVNNRYDAITFTSTSFYGGAGNEIAQYEIVYEDGSIETVPVISNKHVGDWFGGKEILSDAVEVFRRFGDGNEGKRLSAYMSCWANPFPDKLIKQINIVSNNQDGYLMLFALTGRNFSDSIESAKPVSTIDESNDRDTFAKFKEEYKQFFTGKCAPDHIDRAMKLIDIEPLIKLEQEWSNN